ncbi:Abnormal spindlelike microcephalyassociated protein -like protein, partial [Caligus rogercresseyi]
RVMDLLTGQEITSKVRLPAHSRLQKIHNMSLAFEALKGRIDHKEIVNGNVEKTLGLLWHIIFGLGLVGEIQGLRASLSTMSRVREPATLGLSFVEERENHPGGAEMSEPPTARFILTWARLVCAHYGIEVDNLTTAFSDGRALCFLIHHYMPRLLAQEEIMMNTTLSNAVTETDVTTSLSENKKINEELLQNEKRNFKIFLDK